MFNNAVLTKKSCRYLAIVGLFLFNSPSFAAEEGCVSGNCSNGYGTYILEGGEGQKYVGYWKNDKFDGQGTMIDENGTKIVAEWANGLVKRGTHATITDDKGTYEGEVNEKGQREGQGVWTKEDGDKFIIAWKADKPVGQGMLIKANGEKQVGMFKDDDFYGRRY